MIVYTACPYCQQTMALTAQITPLTEEARVPGVSLGKHLAAGRPLFESDEPTLTSDHESPQKDLGQTHP